MTEKKRVLFITPLPLPVHGSSMVSLYIKDSKLINEAFDCDFVNLSTSRRMDEIGKTMPVKLVRFVSAYFRVFGKLLMGKYDLCYLAITCHGIGFLKDAPFVLMCKLFKRKIVLHQHNKGMARYVDKPIYKWLLPLVYRRTTVILLSWLLYSDIEKVVGKEQILICPNGIPELKTDRKPLMQKSSVPKILFLSNLIASKGVWVLLDACRILKERGYKFCCEYIGGETKEISAKKFCNEIYCRGLDKEVNFLGRKYGKEKEDVYCNADMFVQPTFEDCFPLTLIEAMQNHLPVVTTNEGANCDIVTDGLNGYIVPKNDSETLADAIAKLLESPEERMKMGQVGYTIYKEKFTLKHFEKNMIRMLNAACF